MNEIIKELLELTQGVGNGVNGLYKVISGDMEREIAEKNFYTIKRRYMIVTVVVFLVCVLSLVLKFCIL